MRKGMAFVLGVGLLVQVGMAQNPTMQRTTASAEMNNAHKGPKMKPKTPDEQVNEMHTVVNLSDEQKAQVKKLAEEREAKAKALREEAKNGADKEAIHQKMMALRKEQRAELGKVLNKEQLAKWDAYRKEQRAAHVQEGPGHKPRSADEQLLKLDEIVGLTAEQKPKVKSLLQAKEQQIKALREEQKNTPDEKAFKEKKMQVHKEYKTELDKLLTADQKAKLKAHREQMKSQKPVQAK